MIDEIMSQTGDGIVVTESHRILRLAMEHLSVNGYDCVLHRNQALRVSDDARISFVSQARLDLIKGHREVDWVMIPPTGDSTAALCRLKPQGKIVVCQ